jgi:hypothetical protein
MLFREIIPVSSENHTKHISTLSGQNTKFFSVVAGGTPVVTTVLLRVNTNSNMIFECEFSVFHGIQRFINMLSTRVCNWTLS